MADFDKQIVVGIDSGGSTTRVACVDRNARVVGHAIGGSGSPQHSSTSEATVRSTLQRALSKSGRSTQDVVALAAGMAGLNVEDDQHWAATHTELDGITSTRVHVNDTVVAHLGAFLGEPGVLVVAGTGSMILGIDRDGRQHRNDQLHHYAGAARHLAYDVVHRLLIGDGVNDELGPLVLKHWHVTDLVGLRAAVEASYESEAVKRAFGTFAPIVTAHTQTSPLARGAVKRLAALTAVGIQLVGAPLGAHFTWSGAGSVATNATFVDALTRELEQSGARARFHQAAMNPLGGAVLLGLRTAGWESPDSVNTLAQTFKQ